MARVGIAWGKAMGGEYFSRRCEKQQMSDLARYAGILSSKKTI